MSMHLYAFGSICRGDLDQLSDVDLLALIDKPDDRLDSNKFSIYSYKRIKELWYAGNPFAWHLWAEGRLLFASDKTDFLKNLGEPLKYNDVLKDCEKFLALFNYSVNALISGSCSRVFEISNIFLAALCVNIDVAGNKKRISSCIY